MILDYYRNKKQIKTVEKNTRSILHRLSVEIGERTIRSYDNLLRASEFITDYFLSCGASPRKEHYEAENRKVWNIIAEIPGKQLPGREIVIGAHYDTIENTPGADDNASGIAGLLELFRLLSAGRYRRTLRFVAFTLEEPPYFFSDLMGSMVHAKNSRMRNDPIDFMLCLEMLGYGGRHFIQNYPMNLPTVDRPPNGDFLAVVSLPSSARVTYLWKSIYSRYAGSGIFDLVGPSSIPGISHSDHYSFNRYGFHSIMLTDTAFYRNCNYHTELDSMEKINFPFMSRHILYTANTIREIADMESLSEKIGE